MNTQPTTSNLEPQTAEFQAAVDNVWFENKRNAREIEVTFNDNHELMWDRWDYIMALEEEIEAEVFHASHSYRLYS